MPVDNSEPVNEGSSSSTNYLKDRRFKLSRACDRCRRRRIKCDEGHPCQACLTSSSDCTFEEPGKRTHPHKSKRTATLEDRMRHLETLIHAIPPTVFAAANGSLNGGQLSVDSPTSPTMPAPFNGLPGALAAQQLPLGVPPPSLSSFPLMNPGGHFTHLGPNRPPSLFGGQGDSPMGGQMDIEEGMTRMSINPSYLYLDQEGYTRWQGEMSGLPLLDLLVDRHSIDIKEEADREPARTISAAANPTSHTSPAVLEPSPSRRTSRSSTTKGSDINPEALWKTITNIIVPELMDSLVQCYLSTSYYLMPFLHVPTFLADYGNPQKWGEPGFASFIVALCCLSSRHIDDPRVRADPNDGVSAGSQWFDLFLRLRALPSADRPTLYTIQGVLVAGVYAVGAGKLSKAFALLSEAITLSVDAGIHRCADAYDYFDPIEEEVRKRTFWCVYLWDKQASAHFGRPPMIRLRDCDVREPAVVDDEFLTNEGSTPQPGRPETESRMFAFVCTIRLFVVLESVVDAPPSRYFGESSAFLTRATGILSGFRRHKELREEEALLDEVCSMIPPYWKHSPETMASEDVLRVTQAERLHCMEQYVRMLIHRHRFSELVADRTRTGTEEQSEAECEAIRSAHACALQIVAAHLHIGLKGMMTWYGVHVIHQLTQAGRTLTAVVLNSEAESLRALKPPSLDALRSCVGLLRRFSGRYVCGMRSSDMMEEFCRLTQIPLDTPARLDDQRRSRTPWMKPVRKKTRSAARSPGSSTDSPSQQAPSPEGFSPDIFLDMAGSASPSASAAFPMGMPPASVPSPAGMLDGFGRIQSSTGSPFMDGGTGAGMMGTGPEQLGMSSAEILALFNDGGVDVSTFFPSPGPVPTSLNGNGRHRSNSYANGALGMTNSMGL